MDLVEIRKKAKKKKKPSQTQATVTDEALEQQAAEQPDDAEQQEPEAEQWEPEAAPAAVESDLEAQLDDAESAEEEELAETVTEEIEPQADEQEGDPLDALFAYHREEGLADTESYLQSLVADDEIADTDIEQWLTFSLGDEEYALSIESVSEIIKPREVTDIPRVPEFISGIISLRGIIVPVFDLNKRLSLGSAEMSSTSRIIVCTDGDRLAGFVVDRINQVVNVPINNIEPPPTVLSGLDRDFVEGVGRVDDRMLILLHLSNVINAELI